MSLVYGVDYYPEHWPENRWAVDAQLMRDAGFRVVRMAEFSWSRVESEPGRVDWRWLDSAIDCLHHHGIKTILGTPTATPPLWLVRRHPEIRGMALDGTPWYEGSRRHTCPTSPVYRRESGRIVRSMAERYRDHPGVIGWQIDNELGCHVTLCGCPNCERGFRDWARDRYGTIEAVNAAWGTVVWSNELRAWEEIPLPRPMPALPNPSLALAYRRFISDAFVQFHDEQVRILRDLCPEQFITHNMMGLFSGINYYHLSESLDFVSWDNYPGFFAAGHPPRLDTTALAADVMRGVKSQRPFWVMEQQAGPTTWEYIGPTPKPGQIRLWAYQAIARGADGILYFRWRTNPVGPEQFWHGLLDHSGQITRRYTEAKRLGEELTSLAPIVGTRIPAEVAIVRDYETLWALEIQHQTPTFSYDEQIAAFHSALDTLHIPVDLIAPSVDLTPYRLVILPSPYILHPGQADRLSAFVRGGGRLVVTARAGVKTVENVVIEQPLPGALAEICGVVVEEYDALIDDQNALRWSDTSYPIHGWADILHEQGAQVLATYQYDYYAGRPALIRNTYGRGQAVYLGTLGSNDLYLRLIREEAQHAGVTPLLATPLPVEASRRVGPDGSYLFVLNHGGDAAEAFDVTGVDLLTGRHYDGRVTIAPFDVVIIREETRLSVPDLPGP